jgi:gluconate 2-dehydrogenase gamma chain
MSDDEREVDDQHDTIAEDTPVARLMTRRRALQVLGAVPVAAALGQQQQTPPQQQTPLIPGVTSQVPTKPGQNAANTAAKGPTFFNRHEWKTVAILADYIIPRDEHSGSATDAKVPEYMDFLLSEKDANVNTQVAIHGGLAWLDTESRRRFGKTFIEASDAQRRQILDDIAYPRKAKPEMSYGVNFFNHFRDMTASGFFSSAMGWKDVQYVGNVFNPGYDGCPPAALQKLGVSYDLMQTRVSPQEK